MTWGTDPGELHEMWRWAGTVPGWHGRPGSATPARFTADVHTRIGEALSAEPEGTVAIVLVNWADERGRTVGGHWFTAAVTEHGVQWIDGQTAEHRAWPPPYAAASTGSASSPARRTPTTWVDLASGALGTEPSRACPGGTTPAGARPSSPDPLFATRIANATGEWPDDEHLLRLRPYPV